MKLDRTLAALALCILFTATVFAQIVPPADLDAWVARSMQTFEVPGLSLAIVKNGKVVVAKGYGVRKLGDATPVDENTLFAIGSNTKAFTAACLAMLVDEGKIAWDDPVYQRLPAFRMYDPYVSHEMTIRDLLTHRSGMGLGEGDLLFLPHTTYTREDIIHQLRYMKPASSFRSRFAYDNLLYMTAGQIVPAVTGTSWDDFVRQRIFVPLGMSHSNVSITAFRPGDNVAYPHSKLDGKLQVIPFENLDNAGPAGSINFSAADMAKWVLLQLNWGNLLDREGPLVKVTPAANAMYNDPELTNRLVAKLRGILGQANVVQVEPTMVFEDFAEFNLAGIPSADFWVGAVEPAKFAAAQQSGTDLPQLHSSTWAPDYTPTLKTVMAVETTELLELLGH